MVEVFFWVEVCRGSLFAFRKEVVESVFVEWFFKNCKVQQMKI